MHLRTTSFRVLLSTALVSVATVSVATVSVATVSVALVGSTASAQTLDRAVPAAGGPGDLILLQGTGLQSVTQVHFTGSVGGFAGFLTQPVAPLSATPTELHVLVPQVGGFVGPIPSGSSGPLGFLTLNGPWVPGPQLDFFFFEEPTQQLTTVGQGSAQSGPQGRAVSTFDVKKGAPKVATTGFAAAIPGTLFNNPNFTARLMNAMPNVPAVIAFGAPATQPYLQFGDGDLVVDSSLFVGFFAGITDAQGDLDFPAPIPAALKGTLMMQFLAFDPGLPHLVTASGLEMVL